MIKLKNITKKYGEVEALKGINFEVKEGEIVGLLGPNGAGKSTTMNIITGFIEPSTGIVQVNGIDVQKNPIKAKRIIGYMPEGVPLYSELTVKEFVKYMAELKRVPKKEINLNVQKVLEETGVLEVQNTLIRNLSRGYKQRVSLAGTLVSNPKVIILDEPTVGLDPRQVKEIRELIKKLGEEHTVILSSHILSEVSQICNRVIIMNKGKVIATDSTENLERKVSKKNIIYVTVEDKEDKVLGMKNKIEGIKSIKFEKRNEDGSKQYAIEIQGNKDIRKNIFTSFAKESLTIFEMKKAEISLEDAFMKLIERGEKNESNI